MHMGTQKVLITGGTRGIGFELARALVGRGAAVAVCGRAEAAPASLAQIGRGVQYFGADLTAVDDMDGLVTRIRAQFGAPTMLINNAGVQFNHDWTETRASDRWAWARSESTVNLLAPLGLTALLLDDLLQAPEAAIVNVTSTLALTPKRSAPVYSATKAALRSLTKGLRYQLADHPNVRVVEVLPPVVDTAMTAGRGTGKMDAADVAEIVVRGIESGREEIWVGKAGVLRVLWRLAPGVVAKMMRDA